MRWFPTDSRHCFWLWDKLSQCNKGKKYILKFSFIVMLGFFFFCERSHLGCKTNWKHHTYISSRRKKLCVHRACSHFFSVWAPPAEKLVASFVCCWCRWSCLQNSPQFQAVVLMLWLVGAVICSVWLKITLTKPKFMRWAAWSLNNSASVCRCECLKYKNLSSC